MKRVYFNRVQMQFMLVAANTNVAVCGRRTGKTHGIGAPFLLRCVQRMPGSTGGIVVPTFLHGLTNTIPGLLAALEDLGYHEGIHYVIGKKPPEWFAKPIIKPTSYKHAVSFYNGTVCILLSQDRAYAANSLTLSFLLIDEAKFIDYAKLKDQTLPANGGIRSWFRHTSANHAMMIMSDMPQTQKGSWFLNYRDKMDERVIDAIKGQVNEIWRVRNRYKENPDERILRDLRRLDRELNQLRSVAVHYKECSSLENIELIGEKYIRQMKRDLTPLTFRTSILCERLGQLEDGFYNNMTDDNLYDDMDMPALEELWDKSIVRHEGSVPAADLPRDRDINPDEPILIGMDYNANINWIVSGQTCGRRLNVVKSFFTKYTRKIPELMDDFCAYYRNHRCKHVVFYHDSTAIGQDYWRKGGNIRQDVIDGLRRGGWTVTPVYLGRPMAHDQKYRLINNGFAMRGRLVPYINKRQNEDLILAMQCAGVENGRNGFHKYKGGEKVAENEENLLEHRTDGTDAFDTLYIGAELHPTNARSKLFVPTTIV